MTAEVSPRRPRARRPKRTGRLQARDTRVLTMIGRTKGATIPQITALHFGDPSTAARRLAVLNGMGLVNVLVRSLNLPNLYTLSKRGVAALVRAGVDADELFSGRLPTAGGLDHLLGIGDLRVALLLEVDETPGLRIETLLLDHELRRLAERETAAHIPDLLVRLVRPDRQELTLALELDLGEESAAFFGRTKGTTTMAIARAKAPLWGFSPWRPLVVDPSLPRLRHLARALDEVGAGDLWLGTTTEQVNKTGLLGPSYASARTIVRTAKDALPAFTDSPLDLTQRVP